MDNINSTIKSLVKNVDDFFFGAASVHDSASLESELTMLQSKINCAQADALLLQALLEVAKNSNANKGKTDDTHIAKYENALVDDASVITHPQNMAIVVDESGELLKALEMLPEEMEHHSSSYCSLLKRIKNIVPKCSSAQLQLLEIQNDINEKLRQIEEVENLLVKKHSELADNLVEQKKQLDKKKSSKDEEYDSKNKCVQNIATEINTLKIIIQGLIFLSPEILQKKANFDILEYTRKPLNLVTYSTEV